MRRMFVTALGCSTAAAAVQTVQAEPQQTLMCPDLSWLSHQWSSPGLQEGIGLAACACSPQAAAAYPAVVRVLGSREDGCGACISEEGHIITALSLLRDNGPLVVRRLDGELFPCTVAAVHPSRGLAVLQASPHPTVAPERWLRHALGVPETPSSPREPSPLWWRLRSAAAFNAAFEAAQKQSGNPAAAALQKACAVIMHAWSSIKHAAGGGGGAGQALPLATGQPPPAGTTVTLAALQPASVQAGAWSQSAAAHPAPSPAVLLRATVAGAVLGSLDAGGGHAWGGVAGRGSLAPAWTRDMSPDCPAFELHGCVPSCPVGTPVLLPSGGLLGVAVVGANGRLLAVPLPQHPLREEAATCGVATHLHCTDGGLRFGRFLRQAAAGVEPAAPAQPAQPAPGEAPAAVPLTPDELRMRQAGGMSGFLARHMPLPVAARASPAEAAAQAATRSSRQRRLSDTQRFIHESHVWPVLDAGADVAVLGALVAHTAPGQGTHEAQPQVWAVRPGPHECTDRQLQETARDVVSTRSRRAAAGLLLKWSLCTGGDAQPVPAQDSGASQR